MALSPRSDYPIGSNEKQDKKVYTVNQRVGKRPATLHNAAGQSHAARLLGGKVYLAVMIQRSHRLIDFAELAFDNRALQIGRIASLDFGHAFRERPERPIQG